MTKGKNSSPSGKKSPGEKQAEDYIKRANNSEKRAKRKRQQTGLTPEANKIGPNLDCTPEKSDNPLTPEKPPVVAMAQKRGQKPNFPVHTPANANANAKKQATIEIVPNKDLATPTKELTKEPDNEVEMDLTTEQATDVDTTNSREGGGGKGKPKT